MTSAAKQKTDVVPANTAAALQRAADLLRVGELVGVPTETVYGLAADAFNPDAVANIFAVKRRPSFDPLIVHVRNTLNSVTALADEGIVDPALITESMHRSLDELMATFWPGPLTLLLPRAPKIPSIVTSGLAKVAVRMSSHSDLQALLDASCLNLAAPSANLFGRVSPTTATHVLKDLDGLIPLILDAGPCEFGIESTIVDVMDDGAAVILRKGAIPPETIAKHVHIQQRQHTPATAPGMLEMHYAPRVPLLLVNEWVNQANTFDAKASIGVLIPYPDDKAIEVIRELHPHSSIEVAILSDSKNCSEAAHNLFSTLRAFEASKDAIVAALPDQTDGLWPAIADRLQKAANHWANARMNVRGST